MCEAGNCDPTLLAAPAPAVLPTEFANMPGCVLGSGRLGLRVRQHSLECRVRLTAVDGQDDLKDASHASYNHDRDEDGREPGGYGRANSDAGKGHDHRDVVPYVQGAAEEVDYCRDDA